MKNGDSPPNGNLNLICGRWIDSAERAFSSVGCGCCCEYESLLLLLCLGARSNLTIGSLSSDCVFCEWWSDDEVEEVVDDAPVGLGVLSKESQPPSAC